MGEERADRIEEVTLSGGSKYKIKAVSMETGYDWLDIEDGVRDDRRAMLKAKLEFFVVEPKLSKEASSGMTMKEGIELIRAINRLNGMGDFTQSQGNSRGRGAGKGTTT